MTTNWREQLFELMDTPLARNEGRRDRMYHFITTLLEKHREEYVEKYENYIKYLKKIHSMELDALSLKSLKEFIIWKDNRIKSNK